MTNPVTEISSLLKKNMSVTLSSSGQGTIIFDPDNARQRWEVTYIVVSTNQNATATVIPVVTIALNTTSFSQMSQGNQRGASWSGNQDTWSGKIDLGSCDFLSILFTPPAGNNGSALSGVIASAIVTGTKFTRRA